MDLVEDVVVAVLLLLVLLLLPPSSLCLPIPDALSFVEAASLPEACFTVWTNVFDRGAYSVGDTVMIHGGTSGIGVTAIQLVKAMGGDVFVTAGSEEKCAFAESIGASRAINYREEDFESVMKELRPDGVNIILDMVGGDYGPRNLDILAVEGRLVMINAMKNAESTLNLKKIMVKRLTVTGSTLRARDTAFKAVIAAHLEQHIWPHLSSGNIRPVLHAVFRLVEASTAHQLIEQGGHIGKVVLQMD